MELKQYQKDDVKRIVEQKRIGIFNEQRTGKTPTTCVALTELKVIHPVIVCPASLLYVWKHEYQKWTGLNATVIDTPEYDELIKDGCIIVSYARLRKHYNNIPILAKSILKTKPDAIVLDEAHRIQNRRSETNKAIRLFNKIDIKIALTGTPAFNAQDDVWAILNWLDPLTFKGYWKFAEEFFTLKAVLHRGICLTEVGQLNKDKKLEFLNILKKYSVQRKRRDCMSWTTDMLTTVVKLPAGKLQLKAITELQKYYTYKHLDSKCVLDNLTAVRQLCLDPHILGINATAPKIDWLKDYFTDYPEKNIVVFCTSKKTIIRINEIFKNERIRMIHGDIPPNVVADYVNEFQTKKGIIILGQTQKCSEGLTLSNGDVAIFLDVYPPVAMYSQAKDRIAAVNEADNKIKEIIHVILEDTYDEMLYNSILHKKSLTDVINDYIKHYPRKEK